jgi:RimJ/RimL family protein N-acetyltransferase
MPHALFLETERLFLRRATLEDARLLYELDSDPEVMRFISRGVPTPLERIEREILPRWLRYYEEHAHLGWWPAHEKASGDFIGWFHLRPDPYSPQEQEVGYRLKRGAWGRGYATEGTRALLVKAFTEWGIAKVSSRTLERNKASQRVMEKAGLRFEHSFVYEERLLPGWSEEERRAVKYGLRREDFCPDEPRK